MQRHVENSAKKPKVETAAAKKAFVTDPGEKKWELERDRFITVSEFKGKKNIQIREYYKDKATSELKPGKKGISLKPNEFKILLSLGDEIMKAAS